MDSGMKFWREGNKDAPTAECGGGLLLPRFEGENSNKSEGMSSEHLDLYSFYCSCNLSFVSC